MWYRGGVCLVGVKPGGCMGRHLQADIPPPPHTHMRWPMPRSVCILLECIFVLKKKNWKQNCSSHLNNYRKKPNGCHLQSFDRCGTLRCLSMPDISSRDSLQHMTLWRWPIYSMINLKEKCNGEQLHYLSKWTARQGNDHGLALFRNWVGVGIFFKN